MPTAAVRVSSPQSVTRVIRILETLCSDARPMGLADLSRALDTPKSSLAALLRGLVAADFVVHAEGSYRLGPGAFGLGSALMEARRRVQSSDLIREGMRRLAERSGETVLLAVRDAGAMTMTYVEVIESNNAVRFAVSAGDRRTLFNTAGGRALLAAATDEELKSYLKQLKPQRFTPQTLIDKRKLAEAIEEVRKTGVAQTIDQASLGVTGAAAALRDAMGGVIAALVVAAPTSRTHDRLPKMTRLVLEEAAVISRSLGYRPRSAT